MAWNEELVALRGQTQGAFNGWLFVYRPAKGVSVEAVGQLCVITADHGTRLAWPTKKGQAKRLPRRGPCIGPRPAS